MKPLPQRDVVARVTRLGAPRLTAAQQRALGSIQDESLKRALGELLIASEHNQQNFEAIEQWFPAGAKLPIKAKGDLITGDAAGAPAILPVGAEGDVLTVDSSAPDGISWLAAAGPEEGPLTAHVVPATALGAGTFTLTAPPGARGMAVYTLSHNATSVFQGGTFTRTTGGAFNSRNSTSGGSGCANVYFGAATEGQSYEFTYTVASLGAIIVVWVPESAYVISEAFAGEKHQTAKVNPGGSERIALLFAGNQAGAAQQPPIGTYPSQLLTIGSQVEVEAGKYVRVSAFYGPVPASEAESFTATIDWAVSPGPRSMLLIAK